MALANEAPASITAEGPTSHTPNQPARRLGELSEVQIRYLLRGIDANRIGKDGKGFSHVEAWDIRRHLIRLFGFGGFDTDLIEMALVGEQTVPNGTNRFKYTVVYRAAVKLTVKVDGIELGHWHGVATGDATNQPSLADAHDLALKTADSQALKRAAINMGDQFGLSLYNGGAIAPVVNASLPYMKPLETPKLPEDPPVQPEPGSPNAPEAPKAPAAGASNEEALSASSSNGRLGQLMAKTANCWDNALALAQLRIQGEMHNLGSQRVQGPPPEHIWTTFDELLSSRIDELNTAAKGGMTNGSAA
jgi:hypothetical protein